MARYVHLEVARCAVLFGLRMLAAMLPNNNLSACQLNLLHRRSTQARQQKLWNTSAPLARSAPFTITPPIFIVCSKSIIIRRNARFIKRIGRRSIFAIVVTAVEILTDDPSLTRKIADSWLTRHKSTKTSAVCFHGQGRGVGLTGLGNIHRRRSRPPSLRRSLMLRTRRCLFMKAQCWRQDRLD